MEFPVWVWVLGVVGVVFGQSGAAWVTIKTSLNGMRDDVSELKTDVKKQGADMSDVRERLARIEGR